MSDSPTWQGLVTIDVVEPVAPGYFKLSFRQPDIAARVEPGLFVNILVPEPTLSLRRPISIHGVEGDAVTMLIGVHGAGTAALSRVRAGDTLDLMGPLGGRHLTLAPGARRVALVGGGVGVPPLRFFAAKHRGEAEFIAFVGARSADRLLCLDEFEALGAEVVASTDDGSAGFRGTNVAALRERLGDGGVDQILTCGPTPMMMAAAMLARQRGVPCQVCLEARMACALGACLSCVVETTVEGWERYQRVCTEGPVFDSEQIVWETLSPLVAPPRV